MAETLFSHPFGTESYSLLAAKAPGLAKRLQNERKMLAASEPTADIMVEDETPVLPTTDRYHCWKLRVPHKQLMLTVIITFPKNYPFTCPYVAIPEPRGILKSFCRCSAPDGTPCVSGFLDAWSPTWTVSRILEQIHDLLDSKSSVFQ